MIPIFQRQHWFVVQVDFELKQIVAYDSMPKAQRREGCAAALRTVHRFVADLHLKEEEECAFDWTGWGQAHVCVIEQDGADWYNCGVFAFLTLWCLARRANVSLVQDVVPHDPVGGAEAINRCVEQWRERLVLWLRTGSVPGKGCSADSHRRSGDTVGR